ncbi:MAG TPA: type II toxin-antitoxin system VapC family toxin [Vicinamibacterales bacterium]|jgi:predicted nucleic acid-binding protein|nr:type II toxin-antitoxin system VapC family toxin [Vicinamibacterales bacterium]
MEVDTNVVAYFLLGTKAFADEARICFQAISTPVAPAHWEAELTNVVWMAIRTGVLTAEEGPMRLGLARRLGIESVATSTLRQGALLRAVTSGVPVYDTLFVELAARAVCPLVTFDEAVLRAFPDIARRPREL